MHELAIIQGVLEIIDREAAKCGAARANKVRLRVGEFTGVDREALEFSFAVAKAGTISDGADLEIESVQLRKRCPKCGDVATADGDVTFQCPGCRGPVEIISGRELQVEFIDFD